MYIGRGVVLGLGLGLLTGLGPATPTDSNDRSGGALHGGFPQLVAGPAGRSDLSFDQRELFHELFTKKGRGARPQPPHRPHVCVPDTLPMVPMAEILYPPEGSWLLSLALRDYNIVTILYLKR